MTIMMKMTIMPVSRDDLFLWQAAMLSATGAVSHVQFSPTWNHDDDDHDDDDDEHDDDDLDKDDENDDDDNDIDEDDGMPRPVSPVLESR